MRVLSSALASDFSKACMLLLTPDLWRRACLRAGSFKPARNRHGLLCARSEVAEGVSSATPSDIGFSHLAGCWLSHTDSSRQWVVARVRVWCKGFGTSVWLPPQRRARTDQRWRANAGPLQRFTSHSHRAHGWTQDTVATHTCLRPSCLPHMGVMAVPLSNMDTSHGRVEESLVFARALFAIALQRM